MTTYHKSPVSESDARSLLTDYRDVELMEGGAANVSVAYRLICSNPAVKRTIGVIAAAITLPILETVIRLYEENAALKAEALKSADLMLQAKEQIDKTEMALKAWNNFNCGVGTFDNVSRLTDAALSETKPEPQPDIQHKFELD